MFDVCCRHYIRLRARAETRRESLRRRSLSIVRIRTVLSFNGRELFGPVRNVPSADTVEILAEALGKTPRRTGQVPVTLQVGWWAG